jgi:hypothetical protein
MKWENFTFGTENGHIPSFDKQRIKIINADLVTMIGNLVTK